MNKLAKCIRTRDEVLAFKKIADTKWMQSFKQEIDIIYKILGVEEEEKKEKNQKKFVLIGDIRSGKSYITATILADILERNNSEFVSILSGVGETTVSLFKFNFKNSIKENISMNYLLMDVNDLKDIAEEVTVATFDKIKEKEARNRELKGCIPKQVLLNTFRLKSVIKEECYKETDNNIIRYYLEHDDIEKEEFVESQSKVIFKVLKNSLESVERRLTTIKYKEHISVDEFIDVLKYVTSKQVSSLLKDVEFNIYREMEEEFQIIDSIGLNHGEGTSRSDNLLRETRLLDIIDKYPEYKMIYVINSINTTNATLGPIDFMDKIGILNNAVMVVSQLDIDNKISFEEFKEEKINDRIDDDLYESINKRMIPGPVEIEKILKIFDNRELNENIGIKAKNDLVNVSINAEESFKHWMEVYLDDINWKRMDSILSKESKCIDEHMVGGSINFSVSKFLLAHILKNITKEHLLGALELNDEISEAEFNERRYQFTKNLLNLCKVYFINYNMNKLEKIYRLRWDVDLRLYLDMSMTRERAKRFKDVIFENLNYEIISTFIKLSAENNKN